MSPFITCLINIYHRINFIVLFFMCLLAFTFTSFFTFNFQNEVYTEHEEMPNMEMSAFVLNRFNDQIIEMNIKGDRAMQYINKEIYINFNAHKMNEKDSIETLSGQVVVHTGDEYDFVNGIEYGNDSGLTFFSEKGVYNVAEGIFYGRGGFVIQNVDMTTVGRDIVYHKLNDVITANNVSARIFR